MSLDKFMTKLKYGDRAAFDKIYESTRKSVYYIALSIVGDKATAEDVMQNAYLSMLRNADKYRDGTNAYAWIARIAKNEALNVKKRKLRECPIDETENAALFGTTETDDFGLLTELARKVLPPDEFTIIMLATVCGYKRREIGEMLEMPTPTVSWKYNNATAKMREVLNG